MALRCAPAARALVVLGLMLSALGGCGQKGSLYLPDQPPPHQVSDATCRTPTCAAATAPVAADANAEAEEKDAPRGEPTPEEIPE